MIKVENIETFGFEAAIRGMRNPMNSWDKSDSFIDHDMLMTGYIGDNDLDLMKRLYKGGTEHRKYLRMIHVQMDVVAPLYWWKEYDTYKVGTIANSCSTMHKIHSKEFTMDDFSYEHLNINSKNCLNEIIHILNGNRLGYLSSHDKQWWWQMIQLLPTSYNQRRTIDMNYENVVTMIKQRRNHKLDEWNQFVEILEGLPYIKEIMGEE